MDEITKHIKQINVVYDWANYEQDKYCFSYSPVQGQIFYHTSNTIKTQGVAYLPSEQACEDLIERFGEDKIKDWILK